jgi:hypothetical protein
MNFIIKLLLSIKDFNIIFTVIDKLFKERYYILCTVKDKETSAEEIIN